VRGILPLLALGALLAAPARGQGIETGWGGGSREMHRRKAIREGLAFLARTQQKDGSWGDEDGVIGVTSLALLAFMAAGHQEDRGEFSQGAQDVLRRGVDYLMANSLEPVRAGSPVGPNGNPVGYITRGGDKTSRMHGHGYATQVLVLAYGSGREADPRSRRLREKIQLAIQVIENAQTITGGWGYEPKHATAHEGSVTVTVVQALRLARDAGFVVDKRVHEAGLKYLRDSQKADGSFNYSLNSDRSSAALTAAALTAMYGFGEYYSKAVRRGLEYLRDKYESPEQVRWFYYANYYAAQAFYRSGSRDWDLWEQRGVPAILAEQREEGYWDDETSSGHSFGKPYATAFACLALSVPDGYLPTFQR